MAMYLFTSAQGNRMNVILMTNSPFCAAPNGANWLLLAPFPTLKRGANHHCASGAIKIRTGLVNNLDSCDGTAPQRRMAREL
jgi:hypothetical protein